MDLTAFIIILLCLQLVCLWLGGRSAKSTKNEEDYFLAGKSIRFFPLMMTFLATQVGGGVILGSAEEAYKFGWWVFLFPLGSCLGLVALGIGVGRRLSQFKVSTVAQIFEVAYRSPALKKIASLLSIFSLFALFIAQIIASNKFMVSLGVENPFWFFLFWGIVILYTCLGGLKAVVATDMVQAAFFLLVFFLSCGFAIYFLESPLQDILITESQNNFSFDISKLSGWLLMPFLFMMIEQDMGQRCFAAENPKTVSKATLWAAGCTFLVSLVPIFFGIMAKSQGIEVPVGSSVLMMSIQSLTNPLVTAFMSCAVLVAILSTADSLINAIGSNISQDFEFPFAVNPLRLSQLFSVGIAIAGILCSLYLSNIVDLMVQSYELSVSCLFVPIIFALFKKEGNMLSASLSILFGALGFIIVRFTSIEVGKELFSLVFSFAGYSFGELLKNYIKTYSKI